MSYSEYDDKGMAIGQAFKEAVRNTPLGPDHVAQVKAKTQAYYQLIRDLSDQLRGERPPEPKKSYGGGGGNKAPSTRSTLDQVNIDIFGDGKPIPFYDQRPAKADGRYSAKAPDFNSVGEFDLKGTGEAKNIPIWILDAQTGQPNPQVVEMLAASGVSLEVEASAPAEVVSEQTGAPVPNPFG